MDKIINSKRKDVFPGAIEDASKFDASEFAKELKKEYQSWPKEPKDLGAAAKKDSDDENSKIILTKKESKIKNLEMENNQEKKPTENVEKKSEERTLTKEGFIEKYRELLNENRYNVNGELMRVIDFDEKNSVVTLLVRNKSRKVLLKQFEDVYLEEYNSTDHGASRKKPKRIIPEKNNKNVDKKSENISEKTKDPVLEQEVVDEPIIEEKRRIKKPVEDSAKKEEVKNWSAYPKKKFSKDDPISEETEKEEAGLDNPKPLKSSIEIAMEKSEQKTEEKDTLKNNQEVFDKNEDLEDNISWAEVEPTESEKNQAEIVEKPSPSEKFSETEAEKQERNELADLAGRFIEKIEATTDWNGYNEERKKTGIKLKLEVFLARALKQSNHLDKLDDKKSEELIKTITEAIFSKNKK